MLFFLTVGWLPNAAIGNCRSPDEATSVPSQSTSNEEADVKGRYRRPYGPNAPWNVPVANLPRHPRSSHFASLLWNKAGARPGNFNIGTSAYAVYDVKTASGLFAVTLSTDWGNLDGKMIPWNPKWRPGEDDDAQIIMLDPTTGREWNFYKVAFKDGRVTAKNGNLVPGSYWTKEDGFSSSRGAGIQYLAMLVRPEEIEMAEIRHALSMPIINTDGAVFVAPATKLEHPEHPIGGIPEGMRFALDVSDDEIEEWVRSLPAGLPNTSRTTARILGRALRDYGWFITDSSGGAHVQLESNVTAGDKWRALGLGKQKFGKTYPRDLLDGLMQERRIYAIVPSDQYPCR